MSVDTDDLAVREAERSRLVERLCRLQRSIADRALGYAGALDCFCRVAGDGEQPPVPMEIWRNDGTAIDFIEQAVQEKLDRITDARDSAEAQLRTLVARLAVGAGASLEDLSRAASTEVAW